MPLFFSHPHAAHQGGLQGLPSETSQVPASGPPWQLCWLGPSSHPEPPDDCGSSYLVPPASALPLPILNPTAEEPYTPANHTGLSSAQSCHLSPCEARLVRLPEPPGWAPCDSPSLPCSHHTPGQPVPPSLRTCLHTVPQMARGFPPHRVRSCASPGASTSNCLACLSCWLSVFTSKSRTHRAKGIGAGVSAWSPRLP